MVSDVLKFEEGSSRRCWWVNQGQTYRPERAGNYIWAPQRGKTGQSVFHHVNVSQVKEGDLIWHYVDGRIVATSLATSAGVPGAKPAELTTDAWAQDGFIVKVEYFDLKEPVELSSIPIALRTSIAGENKTPFNRNGGVNQGYLFSLPNRFVAEVVTTFPELIPPGVETPTISPAQNELAEDAFQQFLDAIVSLNVDKDEIGSPRLYKPTILLAVMEAIDSGELTANEVFFDWLIPRFAHILEEYGKSGTARQAAAGFFHLQSAPFWRLRLKIDSPPPLYGEPAQIKKSVDHAYFPDPFWSVVMDDSHRERLKVALIDRWFTPSRSTLNTLKKFDYTDSVEKLIIAIENSGFRFEPWQIACYLTALRTKPFLILAGVSGSGKSKLPQLIATATGIISELIPVKPDWTDSSDVLGYVQLQGRLKPGMLLRIAQNANRNTDRQFACIIDEMNLARVEHYFAEILSRLEEAKSNPGQPLLTQTLSDEDAEWRDVCLSNNLALVGTVNMDESTHGFSKKVLDRAFTLEFSEIDLRDWEHDYKGLQRGETWPAHDWQPRASRLAELNDLTAAEKDQINSVISVLIEVNEILTQAQLQLAYRSRDEIALFVLHANDLRNSFILRDGSSVDPVDLALQMKVLPRIAGGSGAIRRVVLELLGWSWKRTPFKSEDDAKPILTQWSELRKPHFFPDAEYPRTCARLCLMWERIHLEGYTSFWL